MAGDSYGNTSRHVTSRHSTAGVSHAGVPRCINDGDAENNDGQDSRGDQEHEERHGPLRSPRRRLPSARAILCAVWAIAECAAGDPTTSNGHPHNRYVLQRAWSSQSPRRTSRRLCGRRRARYPPEIPCALHWHPFMAGPVWFRSVRRTFGSSRSGSRSSVRSSLTG
jgi:hypothetical protein